MMQQADSKQLLTVQQIYYESYHNLVQYLIRVKNF